MGHYDSCYEHEEALLRAERRRTIQAVLDGVRKARREFSPWTGHRNELKAYDHLGDAETFLVARLNELG